ncbi:MAG: APC family permease [Conexivisphaerales archaeon]
MADKPTESVPSVSEIPASAMTGRQGQLKKVLSLQDLYFLSLGGIIGSGWLFGSLYAAENAGPSAFLSWIIGGIFVLFIALTWAELGGMLPGSGSLARVPQYAHGYFAGFYFGWAYFVSAVTVPPVEAIAVVTYASFYAPSLTSHGVLTPLGYAVSIVLMVALFLLNYFGIRIFGRFNTGITWWKLLIPTITVILLISYFYPPNFSNFGGFTPYGTSPIFASVGTAGIVFSYLGFRQAIDYSGEAKNPSRDVPRATIYSVLTGIVIYTLLQIGFVGAVRPAQSGLSPFSWANLGNSVYSSGPLAEVFAILGLTIWTTILLIDAIISPMGTLGIYTGTSARVLFALSEGGHLPEKTGDVHQKYRIPWVALVLSLVIGIIFLFAFPAWGPLATVVTSTTVFTYLAGATALQTFRRVAPELKRSYRLPAANVMAPLGFIMATLIVYWTGWPYTLYAFIAIILGLIAYAVARSRGSYKISDIKQGIWIVIYSIVMVILSYFGSYGPTSSAPYPGNFLASSVSAVIPFPYDFIPVIVVSIIFYIWGSHSGYETDELKKIKELSTQATPSS